MTTPAQAEAANKIREFLSDNRGRYEPATVVRAEGLLDEAVAALDPEWPPFGDVDISNQWLISVTGLGTSQPLFNFTLRPGPMTADEALVVAAWLVTLADPLHERFPTIERMVQNS